MPDESAKIILAATHGKLTKVRDCLLIEDSINSIQCQFEFRTSDWDNTSKTAVFVRGWATPSTPSADMIVVMLDENNTCNVPYEVLNKGSSFSVGVFGSSDGYRIVSNWMYYKIKDGCFSEGSSPIDPSSTVYEQILEALSKKSNVGHTHNEIKANADAIIAEKNRAEGVESGLRGNIDEIKNDYLKSTDKEELKSLIENGSTVQSDWNQSDKTAKDYIKNRTHYVKNLYPEAVTAVENPTIDTIYLLEDFTNSKVNLSGLQTYLTSDCVSKKDGEVLHYDGLSLKLKFLYSTINLEIWPSADDISLIDTLNYKIACVGGNITFYVILNTSTLTSEYSSKFSQVGIYGVAANKYVKSMSAYVVQCYMLDDKYISSDLVTDRNLIDLDTTDKTVVGAINEVNEKVNVQSDWNQNDEIANDYIKNKPTIATDNEVIDMLIEADMLCAVSDFDGSLLTDENSHILLY